MWSDLNAKYGSNGSNSEKLNRALRAEVPASALLLDASQVLHLYEDKPQHRTPDDVREIRAAAALVDAALDALRAGVRRRWGIGQPIDPAMHARPVTAIRPAPVPAPPARAPAPIAVVPVEPPASARGKHPPASIVARMGKEPDAALARECHVSAALIADYRRRYDIEPCEESESWRWTPAMDKMLGAKPDGELATLWGMSSEAVRRRRVKLGIAAGRRKVGWTAERLQALRDQPDNALAAAMLGISVAAAKTARSRMDKGAGK